MTRLLFCPSPEKTRFMSRELAEKSVENVFDRYGSADFLFQ